MTGTVLTERRGAVLEITLNRPDVLNAFTEELHEDLRAALTEAEDPEVRAVIVTGAGRGFCAGADLKALSENYVAWAGDAEGPCAQELTKPLIAAVEGHAVAGGLGVALRCDIRVASETAVFGVFCRRFGVPMSDGTTVRLPRIIGQGRALHMLATGEPVDATTALAWGLATRLTPAGQARAAAVELAQRLVKFPQVAMRSDMQSARMQWNFDSLQHAFSSEKTLAEAAKRAEAAAGAARFAGGEGRHGER